MRVLVAFGLVVALAGCFGPKASDEPPLTTPPVVIPFSFTPELTIPQSERFAEPGIKIAPDGTIYVTAPGTRGGLISGVPGATGGPSIGDTIWRSDDGGVTFIRLPTPDAGFGGGDSDIVITPDGTLYHSGLWAGCVSLSVSTDKGMTWRTNPLACGYSASADDRNWLAARGNQYVYLTFGWAPNPQDAGPQGSIALVRTLVGGQTVTATTTTYEDNYQWPGNIAVDQATGTVYVTYNTRDDSIVVLRSTDDGLSLSKTVAAQGRGDTFDSFSAAAVGQDGTVYVTWSERNGKDGQPVDHTDIYYAWSKDRGDSWSMPVLVNSATGTHIFPWIDAGKADHVVIAWYGTAAMGADAESVDGLWYVHYAESDDATAASPAFVEVIPSERPITKGSICTSGTGCAPGTRTLLDYFQVALDPAGAAHIIWATKSTGPSAEVDNPVTLSYAKQLIGPSASPTN